MGYLANFVVYTLAMVGVIVVALLVFKNTTSAGIGRQSKHLKVIDSMTLAPRKTLYIVSAGKEKFLIAGDVDKTTLISKLETQEVPSFKETMDALPKSSIPNFKNDYMDRADIGIKTSMLHSKNSGSVMRNLVNRMNTGVNNNDDITIKPLSQKGL